MYEPLTMRLPALFLLLCCSLHMIHATTDVITSGGISAVDEDTSTTSSSTGTWGPEDLVNIATNARILPTVSAIAAKGAVVPKYDPTKSQFFDPSASLSFASVLYEDFEMTYADDAVLKGYVGRDVVQLGPYYAVTRFGCITQCSDPHFNGVDGILGLGLPAAASKAVPQPVFFAITDMYGGNYANARTLPTQKFSIFSSDSGAELQLGGTEPDCIDATMVYMPSLSLTNYALEVESLSFGGIELLQFNHMSNRRALPAVLDTGTSCLVIPNSTFGGHLLYSPYEKFLSVQREGLSFYITVQGHLFEIPYRHWYRAAIGQACVQPSPKNFIGLLLGDVVFRSLVVEFDLTHPHKPIIGLAPPNPEYKPRPPGSDADIYDDNKLPIVKHTRNGVSVAAPHEPDAHKISQVPVLIDMAETVYFVNVSIGTPRQTFTVFMDTGSSVFAVFAKKSEDANLRLPSAVNERAWKKQVERVIPKEKRTHVRFNAATMENNVRKYAQSFAGRMRRRIQRYVPHHKRGKNKGKIVNPIHFLQTDYEQREEPMFAMWSDAVTSVSGAMMAFACAAVVCVAAFVYRRRRRQL